ncbi:MAG: phosphatase PAP2 family protein [Sphingomicrobium sp.]
MRRATLWVVIASILIALAMLAALRVSADAPSLGSLALFAAAALLASAIFGPSTKLARLGDCFGAQGLVALAGFAGGVISLMGLGLHFPVADTALMAADRALGLDGAMLARRVAQAPGSIQQVIGASYTSTLGVLLVSLAVLAFLGERLEVWRAAFCFAASLLTVCLISILMPAQGLGIWLSDDVLAGLPDGAAIYALPTFAHFYAGKPSIVRLESIDAVVCFPSFHIIMGLIIVTLWRRRITTLLVSMAFFAAMAIGTVPFGGHYFIDLIGGTIVWAGWFAIAGWLPNPRSVVIAGQ